MLWSPIAGFGFLGDRQEKPVELAARRLSGRVCRRVGGLLQELLKEVSLLALVVGGDRRGGGDFPVRVEPQMGQQNARRFVGVQGGDVLGDEVLQNGSVHEAPGDLHPRRPRPP